MARDQPLATPAMARHAADVAPAEAEQRRLRAVLDSLIDPLVVGRPERDDAGWLRDLIVIYANQAASDWLGIAADRLLGGRLTALLPAVHSTGLFTAFADTADTGTTTDIQGLAFPRAPSAPRRIDVRAVRVDGDVSLSWRDVTAHYAAAESRLQLLERRADTDELTTLFNRRAVLEQLGSLMRRAVPCAVLVCDIDHFKLVNDSHGHAVGDAVLQAVAGRVRESLPSRADLAARFGGDELLVVLQAITGLDEAMAVAEMLRRRTAEPIPTAVGAVDATISIGATLACAADTLDTLLARADTALYQAKHAGRNRVIGLDAAGC